MLQSAPKEHEYDTKDIIYFLFIIIIVAYLIVQDNVFHSVTSQRSYNFEEADWTFLGPSMRLKILVCCGGTINYPFWSQCMCL